MTTDAVPILQKAQTSSARSAGDPFFGQSGPAQSGGSVPDTSSGGQAKPSGNGFFGGNGAGASPAAAQPPPTQTLKMQQAAARNRAQKPSGKKPDAKPVFGVRAVLSALACHPAHVY